MSITHLKLLVRLWKHERHGEIESRSRCSLKFTSTKAWEVTVQFIQAALIKSLIRQLLFATLFLTREVPPRDRYRVIHLVHIDANALRAVLFASSLQSMASESGPDEEHKWYHLAPQDLRDLRSPDPCVHALRSGGIRNKITMGHFSGLTIHAEHVYSFSELLPLQNNILQYLESATRLVRNVCTDRKNWALHLCVPVHI